MNQRLWPKRPWLACLLIVLVAACQTMPPVTPLPPNPDPSPSPPPATGTPAADTGWLPIQPGWELRVLTILDGSGAPLERVTIVRLEADTFDLRIAYRPGEPQLLGDWQSDTGAPLVINGGFFTPENRATGLIVVDGVASGSSYEGFGGMLAVTAAGVEVWALRERPYLPDDALQFGLQSYPVLVNDGEAVFSQQDEDRARRTAVGVDGNGRVLFLVAERGYFTLAAFSQYLAAADLGLEIALNLDGGGSTGIVLAAPPLTIPAFTPLPTVITVYPR